MATSKSWTAQDIKMGKMILIRHINSFTQQDVVTITREYHFVDEEGEGMGVLVPQRVVRNIPWNSIPVDIKDAFVKLHNYTRSKALKDQSME